MSPPLEEFHSSKLPERVQYIPDGKTRKPPVDLEKCKLMDFAQYFCNVKGEKIRGGYDPRARVECEPVIRYFRKCANGLTVETTVWEELKDL